jgi:hypothetical protein
MYHPVHQQWSMLDHYYQRCSQISDDACSPPRCRTTKTSIIRK